MKQHYQILFPLFVFLVTVLVNLFPPNTGFSQDWTLCPFSQLLILSLLENISILINIPTIIFARMTPRSLAVVDASLKMQSYTSKGPADIVHMNIASNSRDL